MSNINCSICNKDFIKPHYLSKYCSKDCSEKARKDFIKKRNDNVKNNPNQYKKKLAGHNKWRKKLNTRNFIDKDGNLLTNQQVKQLQLDSGKKREYNQRYFSTTKGKKTRSKNMSNYYKRNLKARLSLRMRTRVKEFLKIKNITPKNNTFKYVGCTPSELKTHLEKQFYNNPKTNEPMTWMNWTIDGWHIDHIIPLDQGKNEDDAKKLCHYTNLQPMWAKENLKKGNKY